MFRNVDKRHRGDREKARNRIERPFETTAIRVTSSTLNEGDTTPSVQRRRISIAEWKEYDTETNIICGYFIPSQVGITVLTTMLIISCTMAFCVLTALKIHVALVIATLLLMLYVVLMLCLTALTEPGFLPKNKSNPVFGVISNARDRARKKEMHITVEFTEKYPKSRRKSSFKYDPKVHVFDFDPLDRWGIHFDGHNQFEISKVDQESLAWRKKVQKG